MCSVYLPCGALLENTDGDVYTATLRPHEKRHIHRDPWELLSAKVACLGSGRALHTGGNGVSVCHVHLSMKRAQATESHQCERRLLQLTSPPASGHLPLMVLKK